MGQPVARFSARLRRNLIAALLLAGLAVLLNAALAVSLVHESFVSGWLLAAAVGLLAVYNIRRRLPFLPLGSSSEWLQFHVYVGLVAVVLFVLHLGVAVPRGNLELALAALFVLVAGSGVVGLFVARTLPQRLSRRGGEDVLYDRIPAFRREIADRAESLALRAVEETGSTTIADYYLDRLRPFLEDRSRVMPHVLEISRIRQKLLGEMRDLERYLNDSERAILRELAELTAKKDDLDYQFALQAMMKRWQFIHVPLTGAMILLVLLHAVVVHAFA